MGDQFGYDYLLVIDLESLSLKYVKKFFVPGNIAVRYNDPVIHQIDWNEDFIAKNLLD